MRKLLSLVLLMSAGMAVNAQSFDVKVSKATQQYREYRIQATEPTYGLKKVMALVKKIKPDSDDNRRMKDKDYNSLSLEEKFTYCMIHGEDNFQNCDAMPPFVDEEKKIFGYLPGSFGEEANWSDRQRSFLKKNRSKVVKLIRETINTKKRVGINIKNTILELDAFELIPDLITIYKAKRYDQDILTMLMFMMKEGKFEPFMKSQSYEKLYGEQSNYRGYIEANKANQDLVCDRALAFYKSRKK